MAGRVIRPTTDRERTKASRANPEGWLLHRVYRIEWPDGTHTGTGVFVSAQSARDYAAGRGWPVSLEMPLPTVDAGEEEDMCA